MNYFTSNHSNNIKTKSKYIILILLATIVFHIPTVQAKNIGRGFYFLTVNNQKNYNFLARNDNKSLLRNIIKKEVYIVKSERIRGVTAYNTGDIYQCAGDPCISANGENICTALEKGYRRCAANFVPFGTILEIEGYGQCMVTDRMNSRYPNRVDIAFKYSEKQAARNWGYKRLKVKILKKVKKETTSNEILKS